MRIRRSITEPIRQGGTWEERWAGSDEGLIACWEAGRELADRDPDLFSRANLGQLPVLPWRGGVDKLVKGQKVGTYSYLAMLQGLRRQDLDIDLATEVMHVCMATGVSVIFTHDSAKYAEA
jgi:hypothetical protein